MIRLAALALFLLGAVTPGVKAEEILAGLSQNRIAITATFDGSEILVFGAVKREAPIADAPPLNVIVTVAGPQLPVTVRRKERVAGIWVNTDAVNIPTAPSFYAVASSAPLGEALSVSEDLFRAVTIDNVIGLLAPPATVNDAGSFSRALVRLREEDNLYQTLEGEVDLQEATLFDTSIALPANLVEGDYTTRIFLTRGGNVIDDYETVIFVQKEGLERFLYALAQERPLLYALLSLVIAIVAGWGASAAFSYVRG